MAIKFYNTLARKKELFKPIKKGFVGIYTCGPTVYDYAHIGNLRAYAFEDLLVRYLRYKGFKVKQVQNITDVDDKTIRGAKSEGLQLEKYTERYKKAFFGDVQRINIIPADVYPEATKHIPEMVALIKKLMKKGVAYKTETGDIYYSIGKFKGYGKLSKFKIKELVPGARVKQDEYSKEQARDFALWKAWTADDGTVFWETEIGKGRPGWHIECSAMSMKYLGGHFDIHMGGIDNMFPHHENEIAQSEAATGKKFVNYWLHCSHLVVDGKKMSKSLGNFYTLRDLQKRSPMAIRHALLSTHYRQELNFTIPELEAAEKTVERINDFARRVSGVAEKPGNADSVVKGRNAGGSEAERLIKKAREGFESAMDNDLNMPLALAAFFDFMKESNRLLAPGGGLAAKKIGRADAEKILEFLHSINSVLGTISFETETGKLSAEEKRLFEERENARKGKNWAEADRLRTELGKRGILLDDTAEGTVWRRAKP